MPTPSKLPLLEFLYEALRAPLIEGTMARGIVVETDDFDRLRAKLYTLREENMEEFGNLSLVRSPLNGKDLWIICQPKEPRNGEDE